MIIDFEYSNYNATGNEACKINITLSNEISHVLGSENNRYKRTSFEGIYFNYTYNYT